MSRRLNDAETWKLFKALEAQEEELESGASSDSEFSDDDSTEDQTFNPGTESDPEEDEGEDSEEEMDVESAGEDNSAWTSKSGITWSPSPLEGVRFRPGDIRRFGITKYAVSRIDTIEDSFNFFITEEILSVIIRHTNAEGSRNRPGWKDLDAVELRAYFGLLILAGVHRSRGEATSSLWSDETGRPIFRATMSLKRFKAVTSSLRFDDSQTRSHKKGDPDKLAPLRDIWDRWVSRLPLGYRPGEELCVDEQLVGFRGRCSFRQYMPLKPARYGLKMWVLCDVATTYVYGILPYLGKKTRDAPAEKGQGKRVVLELTEGLSGHTVTTDNFFTSYELGEELLKRKNCLVGTVRRNKPELPPKLLQTNGRRVLSSLFGFTSTTTTVSYVPRRGRNVLLLSTKHWTGKVSEEHHQKPKIVLDYNRCRGAVDNLDKLVSTYSCRRGTRRWPMALFSNILDISAYNALVLWLSVNPVWEQKKTHRRRMFLQELGTSLVQPAMEHRKRLPRSEWAAALVRAQLEPIPVKEDRKGKERCHLCRGKRSLTTRFCSKCRQGVCKAHTTIVCTGCAGCRK